MSFRVLAAKSQLLFRKVRKTGDGRSKNTNAMSGEREEKRNKKMLLSRVIHAKDFTEI